MQTINKDDILTMWNELRTRIESYKEELGWNCGMFGAIYGEGACSDILKFMDEIESEYI